MLAGGNSEALGFNTSESSQAMGTVDKTAEFWASLFPGPGVDGPEMFCHVESDSPDTSVSLDGAETDVGVFFSHCP